jgi:hypothetical protein
MASSSGEKGPFFMSWITTLRCMVVHLLRQSFCDRFSSCGENASNVTIRVSVRGSARTLATAPQCTESLYRRRPRLSCSGWFVYCWISSRIWFSCLCARVVE